MAKKTPAQKMKEKMKKRKEKKEFEKALSKDMAKNMGMPSYMRGMGLMLRQMPAPKAPKAPPVQRKPKLTAQEKARMKAGQRLKRKDYLAR